MKAPRPVCSHRARRWPGNIGPADCRRPRCNPRSSTATPATSSPRSIGVSVACPFRGGATCEPTLPQRAVLAGDTRQSEYPPPWLESGCIRPRKPDPRCPPCSRMPWIASEMSGSHGREGGDHARRPVTALPKAANICANFQPECSHRPTTTRCVHYPAAQNRTVW